MDHPRPTSSATLEKRVSVAETIQAEPSTNDFHDVASAAEPVSSTLWTGVVKDSPKAWLVCAAGFGIQIFITGILHAFGIIYVDLLRDFKCGKAAAAWVGSIAYGLTMLLAPVSSIVINKYGSHVSVYVGSVICSVALLTSSWAPNITVLYFTFSVVFGVGNALAYIPTMTIAGDYFDKHFTVAMGIMTSGTSVGTLVISPVSQLLIGSVGWRGTMRVLSIFALVGVGAGYVFTPKSKRPNRNQVREIKKSGARSMMKDLQLWKDKVFLLWVTAITLAFFGYYIPYVHLVSHVVDLGMTPAQGSILLMVLGGSTAFGRIVFGKLVDTGIMDRLHMQILSLVITGTGTMLLPLITNFWGILAYVLVMGMVDGCYVVLLSILTLNLMGADNHVVAFGYLTCANAITFMIGPPVAGWIFDLTGSYNIAFHVAGVPIILGALVLFFIPWAQRTAQRTNIMRAADSTYNIAAHEEFLDDELSIDRRSSMVSSAATMVTSPIDIKRSYREEPEGGPIDRHIRLQSVSHMLEMNVPCSSCSHFAALSSVSQASVTSPASIVLPPPPHSVAASVLSGVSQTSITSPGSIVRPRPRPSGSQLVSPTSLITGSHVRFPANLISTQVSQSGELAIEYDDLMSIRVHESSEATDESMTTSYNTSVAPRSRTVSLSTDDPFDPSTATSLASRVLSENRVHPPMFLPSTEASVPNRSPRTRTVSYNDNGDVDLMPSSTDTSVHGTSRTISLNTFDPFDPLKASNSFSTPVRSRPSTLPNNPVSPILTPSREVAIPARTRTISVNTNNPDDAMPTSFTVGSVPSRTRTISWSTNKPDDLTPVESSVSTGSHTSSDNTVTSILTVLTPSTEVLRPSMSRTMSSTTNNQSQFSGLDGMFQSAMTSSIASSSLDDSYVVLTPPSASLTSVPSLNMEPQREGLSPHQVISDELIFGEPSLDRIRPLE